MATCRSPKSHGQQMDSDGNPLPCAQCTPQSEMFRLRTRDQQVTRYVKRDDESLVPHWVEAPEMKH